MPNADRAAVAREVLTDLATAWGFHSDERGTVYEKLQQYRDEHYPAPAAPETVTVTVNGVEWQRQDGEWDDAEGGGPPNKADALDFLDRIAADAQRIAELEREAQAACDDAAAQKMANVDLANRLQDIERERDAARRVLEEANAWRDKAVASCSARNCAGRERSLYDALERIRELEAAVKDQGLGASAPNSEGQGPMIPTDGPPSPAPASAPCGHTNTSPSPDSPHARVAAPRRWWLVIDADGNITVALSEQTARECAALWSKQDNSPYTVVPVLEARVTRATVERVAEAIYNASAEAEWRSWAASDGKEIRRDYARAALRALGLTVEDDHA